MQPNPAEKEQDQLEKPAANEQFIQQKYQTEGKQTDDNHKCFFLRCVNVGRRFSVWQVVAGGDPQERPAKPSNHLPDSRARKRRARGSSCGRTLLGAACRPPFHANQPNHRPNARQSTATIIPQRAT